MIAGIERDIHVDGLKHAETGFCLPLFLLRFLIVDIVVYRIGLCKHAHNRFSYLFRGDVADMEFRRNQLKEKKQRRRETKQFNKVA